MPLITVVKKAILYGLDDQLMAALTAAEDTLPPMTVEYLEELDAEVDEVIAEIIAVPTAEEIAAKFGYCEGCEE